MLREFKTIECNDFRGCNVGLSVLEENFSDGSKGYSLKISNKDGEEILIDSIDKKSAMSAYDHIRFAIRDMIGGTILHKNKKDDKLPSIVKCHGRP